MFSLILKKFFRTLTLMGYHQRLISGGSTFENILISTVQVCKCLVLFFCFHNQSGLYATVAAPSTIARDVCRIFSRGLKNNPQLLNAP